jgi:predicted TPR repeat methyltransferase
LNLAVQHHNAGDLAGAGDVYRRILQADPKQQDALHLLGLIAFQEGDYEEAVELMTEALGVNQVFPAAHNNLGAVFRAMGRLEDAADSFRKAIECQEDYAEAHFNLGNVLKVLNHSDDSVASYRKAIALNPEYIEAYNNLGVLLNSQGQLDDSIECFRVVLGLSPDTLDTHYNLGNTLRDLGRLDEAAGSYRKVLDLDPGHLKAQYGLAALTDHSTEALPDGYVTLAFDNFASQFEHQMVVGNCQIPQNLRLLAGRLMDERKILSVPPFGRVLDMGCGTGIAGEEFSDIAGQLHGVDLSEKMLERARGKMSMKPYIRRTTKVI